MESVTVNWVEVAVVTVPVPLLRVTVLFAAMGSKPVPVMISVVEVAARLFAFWVTVGGATMVATCTAEPLLMLLVVTCAVRFPREGALLKVTVNWVAVAAVTVPVPLLKVTILLDGVVLKFEPEMIRVVALDARFAVFWFTAGGATALNSKAPILGEEEERIYPRWSNPLIGELLLIEALPLPIA